MLAAQTTGDKNNPPNPVSKALADSKRALSAEFEDGKSRHSFSEAYTEIIDQYFRQSHQNSEIGRLLFKKRKSFAVLAVGGYGRKELDFHSDIDILILFSSKIPSRAKKLVEEFLYPLWDLGFELGYGVRTVKDCLTLSRNDFEVMTSMMDARFICGDSPMYLSLMETLHNKIAKKKGG